MDDASRAYDKEPGLRLPASASLPLASCWPRPQPRLPVSATGGGRLRCCSNPPARHVQKEHKTKSSAHIHALSFFGGRGWIRTTEAEKQQIYSLSPLATREHAQILFTSATGRLVYFSRVGRICQLFFRIFSACFSRLSVRGACGAHSRAGRRWPRRKAGRAR